MPQTQQIQRYRFRFAGRTRAITAPNKLDAYSQANIWVMMTPTNPPFYGWQETKTYNFDGSPDNTVTEFYGMTGVWD
jgi:hypothetical protein